MVSELGTYEQLVTLPEPVNINDMKVVSGGPDSYVQFGLCSPGQSATLTAIL